MSQSRLCGALWAFRGTFTMRYGKIWRCSKRSGMNLCLKEFSAVLEINTEKQGCRKEDQLRGYCTHPAKDDSGLDWKVLWTWAVELNYEESQPTVIADELDMCSKSIRRIKDETKDLGLRKKKNWVAICQNGVCKHADGTFGLEMFDRYQMLCTTKLF